ncbi:MAG: tRNA uridine-5-carboxymethylaminomethyl(34) synthesis GTPase MnmE, partial [Alkalispirochaeta sp.]
MESDRIAALATPYGVSALAVLRTSGPGSVEVMAALCDKPESVRSSDGGRMKRVLLVDPEADQVLDEVMLGIFRAPHSYTGEDSVEIFCHGSPPGIRRILSVLYRNGFRPAEPGEFTLRAFMAGKVDLTRAEAVHEIVQAQTATSHEMALARLGGSVEAAIEESKQALVQIMAAVTVQLDYPEEDTGEIIIPPETISTARARLQELADTYRTGRLYQEGARVALAGRTNAGKSSLFNAFLKEDRSIVSDTHGTTRDYIESHLDLDGIPVHLYDTAGLRVTEESIEGEGIRRTRSVLDGADLVIYLVDSTEGLTEEDTAVIEANRERLVVAWNKTDRPGSLPVPDSGALGGPAAGAPSAESPGGPAAGAPSAESAGAESPGGRGELAGAGAGGAAAPALPVVVLPVSAVTLHGMDALVSHIVRELTPERTYREGSPVIDSLRQKNLLERAAAALGEVEAGLEAGYPVDAVSLDLQEAINALGEITGEVTSDDILDAV